MYRLPESAPKWWHLDCRWPAELEEEKEEEEEEKEEEKEEEHVELD